jgi:DNA-binding transcriptional regulator YhcF (GntR family)
MEFAVDPTSRAPIFRQLESQVLYGISVGDLRPGDRLPSIRELEQRLGVNRNTIRHAYLELEAKGAIVLRRGCGARVAEDAPIGGSDGDLQELATALAHEVTRRCEASGLDALQFAAMLPAIARDHDARYPRLGFAECNSEIAETISRSIAEHLGRAVLPIDLRETDAAERIAPSVQTVLTPHWHLAETRELVAERRLRVLQIQLRLHPDFVREASELDAERTLVVLRDAESAPGYRELLGEWVSGRVDVALAADLERSPSLLRAVDAVIYTTPCKDVVRRLSTASRTLELVFEPTPEALDRVAGQLYSAMVALKPLAT